MDGSGKRTRMLLDIPSVSEKNLQSIEAMTLVASLSQLAPTGRRQVLGRPEKTPSSGASSRLSRRKLRDSAGASDYKRPPGSFMKDLLKTSDLSRADFKYL